VTQVLVLIELADGMLDSSTLELLAAAAQLGEPAAVVVVEPTGIRRLVCLSPQGLGAASPSSLLARIRSRERRRPP